MKYEVHSSAYSTQPCVFYFPSRLKQTKIRAVLYDEVNRGYKYHHDITAPACVFIPSYEGRRKLFPFFSQSCVLQLYSHLTFNLAKHRVMGLIPTQK